MRDELVFSQFPSTIAASRLKARNPRVPEGGTLSVGHTPPEWRKFFVARRGSGRTKNTGRFVRISAAVLRQHSAELSHSAARARSTGNEVLRALQNPQDLAGGLVAARSGLRRWASKMGFPPRNEIERNIIRTIQALEEL